MFTLDQASPSMRFSKLFQTDLHFVNEILCGFRGLCLAMIAIRRGTRAEKLSSDMVARPTSGQILREVNDSRREFQKAFL